jgi:hypothetical protein
MISMSAHTRADYDRAVAYLSHDPVERSLFDALEGDAQTFRLTTNRHDDDSYDPMTHTIHWDPHSALRTTGGASQSPALGLGHEVDHAVWDAQHGNALATRPDPHYDTLEERRVITGSERHAARTLGEGIRTDHAGTAYRVDAPTAMLVG